MFHRACLWGGWATRLIGAGVAKIKRLYRRFFAKRQARRVEVPLFEIASNPQVQLSEVKARRFTFSQWVSCRDCGWFGRRKDRHVITIGCPWVESSRDRGGLVRHVCPLCASMGFANIVVDEARAGWLTVREKEEA